MKRITSLEASNSIIEWFETKTPYRHMRSFLDDSWFILTADFQTYDKSSDAIHRLLSDRLKSLEDTLKKVSKEYPKYEENLDNSVPKAIENIVMTKNGKLRISKDELVTVRKNLLKYGVDNLTMNSLARKIDDSKYDLRTTPKIKPIYIEAVDGEKQKYSISELVDLLKKCLDTQELIQGYYKGTCSFTWSFMITKLNEIIGES